MFSKRTCKIMLLALLVYLLLITFTTLSIIKSEMKPTVTAEDFIYMFTIVQPFGFFDSLSTYMSLLIFPVIGSFTSIFVKNNNELSNIIQRIGYNNFLKKAALQAFLMGVTFSVISEIYRIILINWNYAPITFTEKSFYLFQSKNSFSNNSFIQLLLFMATAAVGWGIFSVFIFACGLYVKKNAIFLISGEFIGLILLLLPTLYAMINPFLLAFANIVEIPTLVAPGLINMGSQGAPGGIMITWVACALLYAFSAWILMTLWKKKAIANELKGK